MKKLLSILLVLVLCLSIVACSSTPAPTEVVNSFFTALKADDTETISGIYAGTTDVTSFGGDDDTYSDEFEAVINSKILEFEYTTSNEVINEDSATVDVTIKTYDLGTVFKDAIAEYYTQAFELIFSGISEEELNAMLETIIREKLETATFDYEKTVTVSLTKTDEGWILDDLEANEDFMNAISGGLMDFAQELQDSFGDSTDTE